MTRSAQTHQRSDIITLACTQDRRLCVRHKLLIDLVVDVESAGFVVLFLTWSQKQVLGRLGPPGYSDALQVNLRRAAAWRIRMPTQ